jgi:hypothetical protein
MSFPTTITVTARTDMQDQFEGFVSNKSLPGARMTLGEQSHEHRFTQSGEEHRFTVTADLERGEHDVVLEFMDVAEAQGAIEILSLYLNGCPMGLDIYQCEYRPFHLDGALRSHLYMGWPGRWSITIRAPAHENHGGVGFG